MLEKSGDTNPLAPEAIMPSWPLGSAPPHVQLGATAGPALTLFPDQQSQAVHFFGAGLTMLICGAWLAACLDRKQPEKK